MELPVIYYVVALVTIQGDILKVHSTEDANVHSDNSIFMSVMKQYMSVCGHEYICDKDLVPSHLRSNVSYKSYIHCPRCSCDSSCVKIGDCCPDVIFRLPPLVCDEIGIAEFRFGQGERILLVNNCPPNATQDLIDMCAGRNASIVDRLLTPPVTVSRSYRITFKNRHCAACWGFQKYENWLFNISCGEFADFNYLSTYDEIIDTAKAKSCKITFQPSNKDDLIKCTVLRYKSQSKDRYCDSCNVTRVLSKRDEDIEFLCNSEYSLDHRLQGNDIVFKNTFCFMCNPPYQNESVISSCNVTGLWSHYDPALVQSCSEYPYTPMSYPFKNIFCHLCNRMNNDPTLYIDGKVNFLEMGSFSNYNYKLGVEFSTPQIKNFLRVFDLNRGTIGNNTVPDMYEAFEEKHKVNLTNLFQKIHSFSAKTFCDKRWLPINHSSRRDCPTDSSVFDEITCCYDVSFAYPASCYGDINGIHVTADTYTEFSSKQVLLIDGCFRDTNNYVSRTMSQLCEGGVNTGTLYSSLPLNANKLEYKNIFCALCNMDDRDVSTDTKFHPYEQIQKLFEENVWNMSPFDVVLRCPTYLVFTNFVLLDSVISTASAMGCKVQFLSEVFARTCQDNSYQVGTCNRTMEWPERDPDVEWACEHSIPGRLLPTTLNSIVYSNEFCALCNPQFWNSSVIDTCNVTGFWSTYNALLEKACLVFPEVYSMFPFKNRFCKECNPENYNTGRWRGQGGGCGMAGEVGRVDIPGVIGFDTMYNGILPLISLRNIFSLEAYDQTPEPRKGPQCFEDQFFDRKANECRNKTCYPGKNLKNSTDCLSLLTVTNNLKYVLTMSAKGKPNGDFTSSEVLTLYQYELYAKLDEIFNFASYDKQKIYLHSNSPCDGNVTLQDFEILVYAQVFLTGYVNRLQTELDFISIMNGSVFNISDGQSHFRMENSFDRRALQVPVLCHEYNFESSCYVSNIMSEANTISTNIYRPVHVGDLLVCTQIVFEKHEFRLDWRRLIMHIVKYDIKLQYDEFQTMSDGTARVCLNRLQDVMAFSSRQEKLISALSILTTLCVIISILCLLITLVTYSLFRSLRTLPGKNNICMITTLLGAQSFLLVQPHVVRIVELCALIGSLSHFFWLAYFASLGVCSLHMFRVFTGRLSRCESDSSTNKVVAKYCVFSLGVPAVIVTVVVIVSMVTSNGQQSGYASFRCFLTDMTTFIVTLVTPLALMCLCNFFLFARTAYEIKTTPKVQKNKPDRLHFLVYCKLFVLTGLTWTIQVIDIFLMESVLSYISIILNCSQGLFLFLSYVCNKRVFTMYKQLITKKHSSSRNSNSSSSKPMLGQSKNNTLSTSI